MNHFDNINIVIIVGSPRSGTTILSDVLGRHPDITSLHEPYFIWDRFTGPGDSDLRTAEDATPQTIDYIQKEFSIILGKTGSKILVEKTPRNSFKIPFMHTVFPKAKWIHIIRDGRDAAISIRDKWNEFNEHNRKRNIFEYSKVIWNALGNHPFLRNKWQMISYELGHAKSVNPLNYLNQSRWEGKPGWGPRFPGWRDKINNLSVLEFSACQWAYTVETILDTWPTLPSEQCYVLHYEEFVTNPHQQIQKLLDFIGGRPIEHLVDDVTANSIGRWKKLLSKDEINEIGPIITKQLIRAGYCSDDSWWNTPHV